MIRDASIFTNATRYRKPEDRLTQVLGTVLRKVPAVAHNLARGWTDPSLGAAGEVARTTTGSVHGGLAGLELLTANTQVSTVGGRVLDLVLRFGNRSARSASDVVIWIETKHGTDPRPGQLQSYLDDLADLPSGGPAAVVLLAPRHDLPYPDELVPSQVPQRSWQESGRLLRDASKASSDRVDRFLLEELIDHMRDENLTDPEAVRPEHLIAFSHADQAEAALERICEEVHRRMVQAEGKPDGSSMYRSEPAYGWGYYDAWALKKNAGETVLWLDWNALNEPSHELAEGRSLVFVASRAANRGAHEELTPDSEEQARQERLQDGVMVGGRVVRFHGVSDDCERIARVAFPEEVLIGRTLEEQAGSLVMWIVETFALLRAPAGELTPAAS